MSGEAPMSLRRVLGTVAAAHLALLGFMFGARAFLVPGTESAWQMLNGIAAWDAQHYLAVARDGYTESHQIVRPPGVPLLVRVLAAPLRDFVVAGYVLAFLAHVAGGAHFYALLRFDEPEPVARRALLAWLVFPGAFAFVVPLTEAPFFLGVCGAFYWWRRGRLGLASLFALLAVIVRIPGVLLLPALLADALVRKDRARPAAMAAALAVPAAGFGVYLLLGHLLEGDALRFVSVQREVFLRSLGSPLVGLREAWRAMDRPRPENLTIGAFEIAGGLLAWASVGYAAYRRRTGDAVFAGLTAAAFTCTAFWGSNLRYSAVLPPLFPMLARAAATPVLGAGLFGASVAVLALLSLQFARGHWAG